jgi:hypothetical protein
MFVRMLASFGMAVALFLLGGCGSVPGFRPKITVHPPLEGTVTQTNAIQAPAVIYVTDFHLAPETIQLARTTAERIGLGGGVVSRVRKNINEKFNTPQAEKAKKLATVLRKQIVSKLKKAGFRTEYYPGLSGLHERAAPASEDLPQAGWLVDGWFERVLENNRTEEATIGFGLGAGQVEIEVVVADLAANPHEPFLLLGSKNAKNWTPGGLVLLDPISIGARFVLAHGETVRDVKSMGSAIANHLVKFIRTVDPQAGQPARK